MSHSEIGVEVDKIIRALSELYWELSAEVSIAMESCVGPGAKDTTFRVRF